MLLVCKFVNAWPPPSLTFFVMPMPPEHRKLRCYAPIWKDPLGWARSVCNSRFRLACAVGFHLTMCGLWLGSLVSFATVRTIDGAGVFAQLPLISLCILGFFLGVFAPVMYLYALYRIIRIIDEQRERA